MSNGTMHETEVLLGRVHGPVETRIRWEYDAEPFDPGDCDDKATWDAVETYGVMGCIVEIRRPALLHPDAPVPQWEHGTSLWSIVGDDEYHRHIEQELLEEIA